MPHSQDNDMNILLVEDNDLDVEILKRCLKKLGTPGSLVRARDGIEALEILKEDVHTKVLPRQRLRPCHPARHQHAKDERP